MDEFERFMQDARRAYGEPGNIDPDDAVARLVLALPEQEAKEFLILLVVQKFVAEMQEE